MIVGSNNGGTGEGVLDTPTYIAVALQTGLRLSDLDEIPLGWVFDIAAIHSGNFAQIIQSEQASIKDFLGG